MAISRSKVSIYMQVADTDPSTLVSADMIKGEIKSYSQSGGNSDVETDPVFGGMITKEKPREQVEISLEIIPTLGTTETDRWYSVAYAVETVGSDTVYTMASTGSSTTQPTDKMILIESDDGTNKQSIAYNNCNVTEFSMDHNADDNRTITLTFKFSPEDSNGVSNYMEAALAATAMPAFSDLDNN